MKKAYIILIAVFLVIATFFTNMGYAKLTDTLRIQGTATAQVPYGLFITQVIEKSNTNVDHEDHRFLEYTTTLETLIDKKTIRKRAVGVLPQPNMRARLPTI